MAKKIDFFAEWVDDNKKMISLDIFLAIIMFLVLQWIVVNIPAEAPRATIFLTLLFFGIVFSSLDTLLEKNPFFAYVGYGKTFSNYAIALIVGAVIAFFTFGGFHFSLLKSFSIVGGGAITIFYTVIAAPFVEEHFFRGFLNPTFGKLLTNFGLASTGNMIGVVAGSLTFGIFHWFAYGADVSYILTAFIFGMLVSIGNYYFKSRGFGQATHTVANLLSVI